MNTVSSNVEKIMSFTDGANSADDLANKLRRAGKRSGIRVVSSDDASVTVHMDDAEYRVVRNDSPGFGAFASFMKRKRSVLLPKLDKLGGDDKWTVFQTEELVPLEEVVGEAAATEFQTWVNRYVDARINGENAWRSKDHRPPNLGDLVNYGNLRGLLNKLVTHARAAKTTFNTHACFMVRGKDQLVIADPIS